MGTINVRALQQTVFNKNKSGVKSQSYVLHNVRYSTIRSAEIVEYCASNSIIPKAYLSPAVMAITQCIENFLLNGHSIELPGLGIFSLYSRCVSEDDLDKVGVEQCTKLAIRFRPCPALKRKVESATLNLEGVYNIAGENSKGEKYYERVIRDKDVKPSAPVTPTPTPTPVTITATSANPSMGSTSGSGNYVEGATVTLTATANSGYHFTQWQDGNTQNPRQVTASESKTYTASFAANSGSSGGMMGD